MGSIWRRKRSAESILGRIEASRFSQVISWCRGGSSLLWAAQIVANARGITIQPFLLHVVMPTSYNSVDVSWLGSRGRDRVRASQVHVKDETLHIVHTCLLTASIFQLTNPIRS